METVRQAEAAKAKRARPKYYTVTFEDARYKTSTFTDIRDMKQCLKDIPRDNIIGVFKGRQLELEATTSYVIK